MNKHKIIHKFFDPRPPRNHEQPQSDSSEEEPFQLQEVDCNHFFYSQNYENSLLDLFDTQKSNQKQSQIEQEEQHREQIYHYSTSDCSTLDQINRRYLTLMAQSNEQHSRETREGAYRVKFDGKVRAKYFNKQEAVVQVFDAEQYTFDQYQYSQDLVDELLQN